MLQSFSITLMFGLRFWFGSCTIGSGLEPKYHQRYIANAPTSTITSTQGEPKNAIVKQYKKLFAMDEIDLSITDGALDYIVEKAIEYKLGARGLRSLCEEILTDAMFTLPGSEETKLNVTKSYAEGKLTKTRLKKLTTKKYYQTTCLIYLHMTLPTII